MRINGIPRFAAWLTGSSLLATTVLAQQTMQSNSWLDRPVTNWNRAGMTLPSAAAAARRDEVRSRCQVSPARTTAQRLIEAAGWIAYDHLDRPLIDGDVEIVAGMADADAMCRPVSFQIFVFVGGSLAGTLAPERMTTGLDAAAGAVRLLGSDTLSAEFARYGNKDAPCCPTSRMRVRYRIDRSGSRPVLTPVDVVTIRSH